MLPSQPRGPEGKSQARLWAGVILALVLGGLTLYAFAWEPTSRPGADPEAVALAEAGSGLVGFFIAVAGVISSSRTFILWMRLRQVSRWIATSVALIAVAGLTSAIPLSIWVTRFIAASNRTGH